MDVTGLGWCGTRTEHDEQLAHFYEHVLGLTAVRTEPVVGFAVSDLPAAVQELRSAGVELLGEPGPTWQHFRGPDGNVYELDAG
jgi:hypothetical protein